MQHPQSRGEGVGRGSGIPPPHFSPPLSLHLHKHTQICLKYTGISNINLFPHTVSPHSIIYSHDNSWDHRAPRRCLLFWSVLITRECWANSLLESSHTFLYEPSVPWLLSQEPQQGCALASSQPVRGPKPENSPKPKLTSNPSNSGVLYYRVVKGLFFNSGQATLGPASQRY